MHGQQPATRRSRKTLNAFFSKQCSQNGGTCISKSYYPIRLKLFFILKNILLARGGGLEKITKNWKFIIFKGVGRTKNTGKSHFKFEMSLFIKKNIIFVIFSSPPPLSRRIIFKIKKVLVESDNNFWRYRSHRFGSIFWRLDFNDSPGPSAMMNYKKNIYFYNFRHP